MDGVGIGAKDPGDAVAAAHTPTLDWLYKHCPWVALQAHGRAVGMPSDKDMGNSEVGHNTLGGGRVFAQGAKLVADAIDSGRLFEGAIWQKALATVQQSQQALHFIGLLSDGNVHSHLDHLLAMVQKAADAKVQKLRVHVLTDGRDVARRSALQYVERLQSLLDAQLAQGLDYRIASGGGRMRYTMDRYQADWSMVQRGWQLHVRGEGRPFRSASEAISTLYGESDTDDQQLEGFVIVDEQGPVGRIEDGSAVILFNFRGDRAIEISQAFEQEDFPHFDRGRRPELFFAGMMQYDGDLQIPRNYLVDPPQIEDSMGELLARSQKRQLAIAETHKYGHVTYFWNGNRSGQFDPALESYLEIPSQLEALEERPWMQSAEVTDRLIQAANEAQSQGRFDLIRVNYANGDMVGHTGDLRSARMAVEAVDLCLARLVEWTREQKGILIVTADHGNADEMLDGRGDEAKVKTSHTLNPVPFIIFNPTLQARAKARSDQGGSKPHLGLPGEAAKPGLANVAATTLELMGFSPPAHYEPSLLRGDWS